MQEDSKNQQKACPEDTASVVHHLRNKFGDMCPETGIIVNWNQCSLLRASVDKIDHRLDYTKIKNLMLTTVVIPENVPKQR